MLAMEDEREVLMNMLSARVVVEAILKKKEDKCTKLLILLWSWWDERNKVREGEKRRTQLCIAHGVDCYTTEVLKLLVKEKAEKRKVVYKWIKPAEGVLKINCDGAHNHETRSGGWGFVIRDHDGAVMLAGRGKIQRSADAFYAETLACWYGVRAAMEAGMGHIVLETDSLNVKQTLCSNDYNRLEAGNMIIETKMMLQYEFISNTVSHQARDGNKVAHELAKLGCVCETDAAPLLDSIPICIQNMVACDSAARSV
ncbi:hypothetical protein EJB05_08070, partial [Eragrostis curvula]